LVSAWISIVLDTATWLKMGLSRLSPPSAAACILVGGLLLLLLLGSTRKLGRKAETRPSTSSDSSSDSWSRSRV